MADDIVNHGVDLPEGFPAELIDRLVEVANIGPTIGGTWYNLAIWLEFVLGGEWLRGVFIDTGYVFAPGTVGARHRAKAKKFVTRNEFWDLVRNRLSELVISGVGEAFLIRSVRDELRRRVVEDANVGGNDQKRAELAERMAETADDPEQIAAFRAGLAKNDPTAASMTDQEISDKLRAMAASRLLQPTPIETAVDRWAALSQWDEMVTIRLSDEIIDLWLLRFMQKIGDAREVE